MKSAVTALFTKYLSHLSGYVGHALTIVSIVPTAQLDPRLRLAIAVVGLVTTASDHGYKAGSDALRAGVAAAVANVSQAVATAKPAVLGVLLCLFTLPFMTGCAQFTAFEQSPTGSAVIQAAVDVAVATAEDKGISAAQINAIAHKALDADQSATASLAAVSAVVQAEVQSLKLPPQDQAAADILLAALSAAVQAKVGTNATLAQAQTAAAVVINDVIVATGG